ncbi:8312_t:CDS:2 [Rhizophagus irregularis]|nr:8312_t:CDS:2 [Rhizophagus irregularis]
MSVEKNIEEIDQLINKYDAFESKFGVFKILDYDLNLDERKLKFNRYDHVTCEVCDQEIAKFNFICYNCYNKETDCNEQHRMNYGICKFCFKSNISYSCSDCKIFETSDYDLNLEERKAKYENYCYIFCEKSIGMENCIIGIGKNDYCYGYYCESCCSKETDINKKGRMLFGLNYGILKTSDYNLNLKKRKAKFKDFDGILCEKCINVQFVDSWSYYCEVCYKEETDVNKKGLIRFGPNFGIFKTSDYNLDLKERGIKYGHFDGILCEKCNECIENSRSYCYCKDCYNKETDINKKDLIIFGPNFVIFKTSDYNLNLNERRVKYMDFDRILCEKCNKHINDSRSYCCEDCYNKETDINKKGLMKFGPNFGIFKTSDYNLDLEERRVKYMDFNGILCEKCNGEVDKQVNYCTYCYDKEADINKKLYMIYGPNVIIFSTFDYHLSLEERKAKYKEYDPILCEICIKEIDRQYYNCEHCYNNQKINDKCKVCFIGNNHNCCPFYEFQQFLENFNKWISENKFIDNYFTKEQKGEVPDYDLDEDDRLVKYKDFDYILCEKCGIKYHCNYCYDCYVKEIKELNELKSELQPKLQDYENFYFKIYNKETKELKELKELQTILKNYENVYFKLNSGLGIFRQIAQRFEKTKYLIENRKTLINNIRYNGVNKCERKLRSYCDCYDKKIDIIKKKRIEYGKCKECLKVHEGFDGKLFIFERKQLFHEITELLSAGCILYMVSVLNIIMNQQPRINTLELNDNKIY